jgi:hypothetical protein
MILMGNVGELSTDGANRECPNLTTKGTKGHEGNPQDSPLRVTSCPWWFMNLGHGRLVEGGQDWNLFRNLEVYAALLVRLGGGFDVEP